MPLSLVGLLLLGVGACSRPAQPEVRPPVETAPAPEAGTPPAPPAAPPTPDAGEATDAGAGTTALATDAGAATAAPTPDEGRVLSIQQLRRLKPASGTHVIEGYITRVAPCPPCPKGAVCKPCLGEHVVVSDGQEAPESYNQLGAGDVIVFVPRSTLMRQLEVGQKHRLTVRIRPMQSTALPINDVELIDLSR